MSNTNIKELSNGDKQLHGQKGKDSIETILYDCKEKYGYIKDYVREFRAGYEGYAEDQFYCNFLIVFNNDDKWIVKTTTSFRSDRIKGNLWDSYHLKKINPSIKKSLLVYSDGLEQKQKDEFIAYKIKIENKEFYSSIDTVVGQNEFFEMIEDYANQNISLGKKKDKQGTVFESHIASILSNNDNLEKFKTSNPTIVGLEYDFFKKVLNSFNLKPEWIINIKATSDSKDIGTLLSSGSPKTDVIVYVTTNKSTTLETYTISCKKTNANSVSVHQYTADAFADVLDPENQDLRYLLNEFQKVGGINALGEDKANRLQKQLYPHIEKLIRWVIGGYGGKVQNQLQLADYILIYDEIEKDIYIHSLEEYTQLLLKPENEKQFGTPFSWTFASGQKGKDIQLKCKIIK